MNTLKIKTAIAIIGLLAITALAAPTVNLAWDPAVPTSNATLTGYRLYWRQLPNGAWKNTSLLSPASTFATISAGLKHGKTYETYVRAYDSTGWQADSTRIQFVAP